jgi:hypothetical protein
LSIAESTIIKAKAMDKDVPVTIIWDSVAATSPKAELTGDYEKESMGLQARAISKGMRKITGIIANEKVLFVCLNQIRNKIGVLYGDPTTTPGGVAIPFHSSVRIKLGAGQPILDNDKNTIGINVTAKTIKNKVSAPFRSVDFEIHFGKGIFEHDQIFDELRKVGEKTIGDYTISIGGNGAWKQMFVHDLNGVVIIDKKFYKSDFKNMLEDEQYKKYIDLLINEVYTKKSIDLADLNIDPESYSEVEALSSELLDSDSYNDL